MLLDVGLDQLLDLAEGLLDHVERRVVLLRQLGGDGVHHEVDPGVGANDAVKDLPTTEEHFNKITDMTFSIQKIRDTFWHFSDTSHYVTFLYFQKTVF